jgi:hypothetical protein
VREALKNAAKKNATKSANATSSPGRAAR